MDLYDKITEQYEAYRMMNPCDGLFLFKLISSNHNHNHLYWDFGIKCFIKSNQYGYGIPWMDTLSEMQGLFHFGFQWNGFNELSVFVRPKTARDIAKERVIHG